METSFLMGHKALVIQGLQLSHSSYMPLGISALKFTKFCVLFLQADSTQLDCYKRMRNKPTGVSLSRPRMISMIWEAIKIKGGTRLNL